MKVFGIQEQVVSCFADRCIDAVGAIGLLQVS